MSCGKGVRTPRGSGNIRFNIQSLHTPPGILRDKTMADKLMSIHNDYTQNYPFSGLHIMVETFEHSKFISVSQICLANE